MEHAYNTAPSVLAYYMEVYAVCRMHDCWGSKQRFSSHAMEFSHQFWDWKLDFQSKKFSSLFRNRIDWWQRLMAQSARGERRNEYSRKKPIRSCNFPTVRGIRKFLRCNQTKRGIGDRSMTSHFSFAAEFVRTPLKINGKTFWTPNMQFEIHTKHA